MQRFEFQGSRPKPYETLLQDSGLLSCDCPGWTVKREGKPRHCKHTKQVAEDLKLVLIERDGHMYVLHGEEGERLVAAAPAKHTPIQESPDEAVIAGDAMFINPMLAQKMPEGKTVDSYPADLYVMEEKYDGHRIVVRVYKSRLSGKMTATAWSRLGNVRALPDHILREVNFLPIGVYDGELIIPGNKSYGVTAGVNSGKEVLILFDVLEVHGERLRQQSYDVRRSYLEIAYGVIQNTCVQLAGTYAPDSATVKWIWDRGGEGAIIKKRSSKYVPGLRTPDWIKVKQVNAATLTITGFKAGLSGPYSSVNLRDDNGIETTVKTLDNRTLRAIAADPNSYVGKRLVISYHERTPTGNYRHPMWDHLAGEGE